MPKNALFLLKIRKSRRALGVRHLASGGGGFDPDHRISPLWQILGYAPDPIYRLFSHYYVT